MKILILRGRDKSKTATVQDARTPLQELKGVPVRITTFAGAQRSHGAEAVVIVNRGRILSVVASAGVMKLYLSPRAEFRCIEPEPPKAESTAPLKPTEGLNGAPEPCEACEDGCHTMCENTVLGEGGCECAHPAHYPEEQA